MSSLTERTSRTKTIVIVVGTRPQFIKLFPLARAISGDGVFHSSIIHTGQHYSANLSQDLFSELRLPEPSYHLGIGSGLHGRQTGRMLEAIEEVLLREKPAMVIVPGDTNSTLAGALAASKLSIPVVHVEAGLRAFDRAMPEETNRVITDHLSNLLLAPTRVAVGNLVNEGIPEEKIRWVGDVMYDAFLEFRERAGRRTDFVRSLGLDPGKYVLSTIHRAENCEDPDLLRKIFTALGELSTYVPVVVPLHPRTHGSLKELGYERHCYPRLSLTEPVGYLDMLALEAHARLVITDSGGVMREAYFWGVPSVVVRRTCEWPEILSSEWGRLINPSKENVLEGILSVLDHERPPQNPLYELFGDGHAARRIVDLLQEFMA